MTLGGYWPPTSKVEITNFGGGQIVLRDVFFASIFLVYVEPKLLFFAFFWENSPVQPLIPDTFKMSAFRYPQDHPGQLQGPQLCHILLAY